MQLYDVAWEFMKSTGNVGLEVFVINPHFRDGRSILQEQENEAIFLDRQVRDDSIDPSKVFVIQPTITSHSTPAEIAPELPLCNRVALAGTFDHLHGGHKELLSLACMVAQEKVLIGLLTSLGNKEFANFIQPIEVRKRQLETFVVMFRPALQYELEIIRRCSSPKNCSLVRRDVDAIVTADEQENLDGTQRINCLRIQEMKTALPIILKPFHRTVSSTDIRCWKSKEENNFDKQELV
eukprot:TRINITY_DN640_c0_g1_i1.p1 TRINITY_DN640_c0_g1~~TRINITY_DN640_c0_g1_i1.p1  ORF type:complete len:238 (-),score=34.11 TRINITY_DN640_c0_g1_i1:590-1303(-)